MIDVLARVYQRITDFRVAHNLDTASRSQAPGFVNRQKLRKSFEEFDENISKLDKILEARQRSSGTHIHDHGQEIHLAIE